MSKKKYYNQKPIQPIEVVLPDVIEVEVVEQTPMFVVAVDDVWLKAWNSFLLTANKVDAQTYDFQTASGYVSYIRMLKHRKADVVPV